MNNLAKKWLLSLLISGALIIGAFAIKDISDTTENAIPVGSQNCYVLREYEGYVAVFVENDPDCPMTVTDIQVGTLRELDRLLLQTGMKVKTHEKLMMTLEDLGS